MVRCREIHENEDIRLMNLEDHHQALKSAFVRRLSDDRHGMTGLEVGRSDHYQRRHQEHVGLWEPKFARNECCLTKSQGVGRCFLLEGICS